MPARRLSFYPFRFALLTACLGFIGVATARAAKDSVPDWVKAAVAAKQPAYSADTEAVVLLDETTLSVAPDGNAIEHRRSVIKILRPSGRDQGYVAVHFDKDTKILSMHVWSIGPDGHEYAMKDNEMRDFGLPGEGGQLYVDERVRAADPPGRDPGGVIAYEYEQKREPYVHETTWFVQSGVPRTNQSFTLELPPGYTYSTVWAHHADTKNIDLEHQRYRWELAETPAIDLERVPMHPAMEALSGRMTVRYAAPGASLADAGGSWQGIGEWYDALAHDRMVASPEITARAAQLTQGKTDFYEKTEALGEFVQKQIRYFVIEMGVGGYQPHPAADILRNGYGDCKDKATLLVTMLSTVGVHGALMMVDTDRGVVDPEAPSLVGNHMIAAIEIPAGYESSKLRSTIVAKTGKRYLIFDPTWEKTAFGQLEYNLQGGYGILLEGKETQVARLPVLRPELNTVRRTAKFQLQPDGVLRGEVVESRFGDASEDTRYLYSYGDDKQRRARLDQMLGHDLTSFEVKDLKVEGEGHLNEDLKTSFSLTADRYARNAGPLLMVRPRVYGSEGLALDRKARHVPIDLKETRLVQDDFSIELPEGYVLDELPEPVKLDLGFAAYESTNQLTGNILHYMRTYTVRDVSLAPERYPDVQKLASVIENDEQNHAVFKKK